MAPNPRGLWRSLTRHFAPNEDIQVVLDRRQGDRRQRDQEVEQERRREERRRPQSIDFSEVRGFVGEGTQLKGELTFGGAVRLEGHLEGEIIRGEVLIVSERGQVDAQIDVAILQVSGQVQGNINASQRVELLATSRVTGTIRTPCLVIWNGAVFNGKCEMLASPGKPGTGPEGQKEGVAEPQSQG